MPSPSGPLRAVHVEWSTWGGPLVTPYVDHSQGAVPTGLGSKGWGVGSRVEGVPAGVEGLGFFSRSFGRPTNP